MKHLIVVRHGDYDFKGNLSELGKKQILEIANQLIKSENPVILTSTAPRALQSMQIIKEYMDIQDQNVVKTEYLWSGNDNPEHNYYIDRNPKTVMYILSFCEHHDVVILVSHYEVVNDFPRFFTKESFGQELNCPKLNEGQAIHINIVEKRFNILKSLVS